MSSRTMLLLASLLVTGCALTPIDFTNRVCPCAPGWRCTATLRCVACQDGEPQACTPMPSDSGIDGGLRDSGLPASDAGDAAASRDSGDTGMLVLDADAMDAGDASMEDAGGSDAGPQGICDTPEPGRVFCDGFESAFIAWSVRRGTISPMTGDAFRGLGYARASQDVTLPVGSSTAHYVERSGIAPDAPLYIRFWLRIRSGDPVRTRPVAVMSVRAADRHEIFWELSPTEMPRVHVARPTTTDSFGPYASLALPHDTWTCVGMHIEPGAAGRVVATVSDGAGSDLEVSEYRGVVPSGLVDLRAGLQRVTDIVGIDLDDVALGTAPLPCP